MAQSTSPIFPRAVRPAPDPLALYLRPGRNDHRDILNLISAGDAACFGAVFDPTLLRRHAELREQILKHRLDALLDTKTQPLDAVLVASRICWRIQVGIFCISASKKFRRWLRSQSTSGPNDSWISTYDLQPTKH
jgi:hypothetical protein